VRPTLLLTRPEDRSTRFAEEFRARFGADWPVLIAPLTGIEAVGGMPDLTQYRAYVATSEAGVAALAARRTQPRATVWCVGERTAEAARAAGFAAVAGPGTAEGLVAAMVQAGVAGPVFWARGTEASLDLAEALTARGIETEGAVLYGQATLPLSEAARALLAGTDPVLLPLFSPRGAERVAEARPAPDAPLLVAAISPQVARAAEALSPLRLETADRHDSPGMLDALARLIAGAPSA
jgi:uroporphyrinogen-III synthase